MGAKFGYLYKVQTSTVAEMETNNFDITNGANLHAFSLNFDNSSFSISDYSMGAHYEAFGSYNSYTIGSKPTTNFDVNSWMQ
jgi:hypothetical protein